MKPVALASLLTTAFLSAQDGGIVDGRVTNSATGFGISGVAVELRQGSFFYQDTTDEDSAFRMYGGQYCE
jgi:hypothetical protein